MFRAFVCVRSISFRRWRWNWECLLWIVCCLLVVIFLWLLMFCWCLDWNLVLFCWNNFLLWCNFRLLFFRLAIRGRRWKRICVKFIFLDLMFCLWVIDCWDGVSICLSLGCWCVCWRWVLTRACFRDSSRIFSIRSFLMLWMWWCYLLFLWWFYMLMEILIVLLYWCLWCWMMFLVCECLSVICI